MQHKELLECVLDRTLHMTSQEGNMYSSRLLNNVMMSISFMYPKEYRSSDENYDKPVSEYLAVRVRLYYIIIILLLKYCI